VRSFCHARAYNGGLFTLDCSSRSRGLESPRRLLLVYPDDAGFFHLRVLFSEFAGKGAERNGLCLREIRSRPLSLGRSVTRGGEDALFLRHGRIRCVSRMTLKLVDHWLSVETAPGKVVLRKCCGSAK